VEPNRPGEPPIPPTPPTAVFPAAVDVRDLVDTPAAASAREAGAEPSPERKPDGSDSPTPTSESSPTASPEDESGVTLPPWVPPSNTLPLIVIGLVATLVVPYLLRKAIQEARR
jgi:hypothetical protein